MNNADWVRQLVMPRADHARSKGETVTAERLRQWVEQAAEQLDAEDSDDPINVEQLIRDLEAEINIFVGDGNSLSDDADHVPWLENRLGDKATWSFWNRYTRFSKGEQALPTTALTRLDELTNDILGKLEDPSRDGPWDRRGLVAGQVQSGKTGNYTGLIAKAIDNGYKLVVVLAGVHNSLRSQTQARIDEGILGFDTRAIRQASMASDSAKIGVGKLVGPQLYVASFTSSAEGGDFRLNVAQNMGVVPGGTDPIILVIKKNKSILENLYAWATLLTKERDSGSGKYRVRGVPVLVIDDEADHASVNTKHPRPGDEEIDPSAINGLIRQFLDTFERTAYVGYTATPFANIFIDPDGEHNKKGEDLFPRSFIVNLPAPSNYVGPERVFGLQADAANEVEGVEPLPILRTIEDYATWLPDKHKSTDQLGKQLPTSLEEALLFFLISGAIRRLRGQGGKHHSMLVHVTRFTLVQKQVATQVTEFLKEVQQRLAYGEGADQWLRDRAMHLYEDDLAPTCAELGDTPDLASLIGLVPSFDEIWAELGAVTNRTTVHVVNGASDDALEYIDHPEGVSVIAIGGDKLSRGLTLEGLCVSYYLRASKMYDTLMQMGRWFGYRTGYLDVCRLYTTSSLITWYERITSASAELQREFEAMAVVGKTPADFGLRVRQLPDGLLVTSPTKLKYAQRVSISFSGAISETVTFRAADRAINAASLDALVRRLGPEGPHQPGMHIWRKVAPEEVLTFLQSYRADRAAFKVQPKALSDYIRARTAEGELIDWTIVLADVSGVATVPIGGLLVGATQRTDHNDTRHSGRYTVRRLVSPGHELVDLDKGSDRWNAAMKHTLESWKLSPRRTPGDKPPERPSGLWERGSRSGKKGLLLLYPLLPSKWNDHDDDPTPFVGFAASFPASERATPIEYQVNMVTLKKEFGWDEEEFDD